MHSNEKELSFSFPYLNIKRRTEPAATDTVYCDTSAIDDGSKCAQIFVATKILVSGIYEIKSDKQFFDSLEDNIRQRGEIDKIIPDSSQSEISLRVKHMLRYLFIDD